MRKYIILAFFLFALCLMAFNSCDKESPRPYPEVSTLSVSDITPQGFWAHGMIENKGSLEILEMGFMYSLNPLFSESSSEKVIADKIVQSGKFSVMVESALLPKELYYVRAYVKTADHMVFGPSIEARSQGGKSPEITGFSPEMGVPGDTLILKGRHFSFSSIGNKLRLDNVQVVIVPNSTDTTIHFVIPPGVTYGEYELFLTVAANTVKAPKKLMISNLAIHSVEPLLAAYNDTITIFGENFGHYQAAILVFFNEIQSQIVSASPNEIKAIVPANLLYATVKVKVKTNYGEVQYPVNFQLLPPEVLQFLPDTLTSLLDTITIVGRNFTSYLPAINIRVKGRDARLIDATETQIRFRLHENIYYNHDTLISIRDTFHLSLKLSNQGEAVGTPQRFLNVNYLSRFTRLNNFPGQARGYANGFSYGNKGYVILGINGVNSTNQFWEYDPVNDAWSQKPDFPGAPRCRAFSFIFGNDLFIGGGQDGNNYFSDFYKYNFLTNSWTQLADYPDPNTSMAVAFTLNNMAFVGTGYKWLDLPNYSNRIWLYDPVLNQWRQVSNFPRSTYGAVAFSHGWNGYVYDKNKLFRFDGSDWFEEVSPSLNMAYMLAVKNGNKVYVGLGAIASVGSRNFYEFNLLTGQWVNKPIPISQRRYGSAGFAIDGRNFILGGFGEYPENFHDFWEYNPDLP